MRQTLSFVFFVSAILLLAIAGACTSPQKKMPACPGDPACICDEIGNCALCGTHECTYPKTCENCETDCGPCDECGNGECALVESCATCPEDCGYCGSCSDGECRTHENEDCETCPADCGICPARCGDEICASNENCVSCEADCGPCPLTCGNGICDISEDCHSCPLECGTCPPHCGDGVCSAFENEGCGNCPADCGLCDNAGGCFPKNTPGCTNCTCRNCVCMIEPGCCQGAWDAFCVNLCVHNCFEPCPAWCGDGICDPDNETCTSCPADCAPCIPTCGDGFCNGDETCRNCESDCGLCSSTDGCFADATTPGCTDCTCFDCVCAHDSFCCMFGWDEACVTQCSACGQLCTFGCGNGLCEPFTQGENAYICPDDCMPAHRCGDGLCAQNESPVTCPQDCGPLPLRCGDGECHPVEGENCFSCPDDCPPCAVADPCTFHTTPGIGDTAPRNCVCARDPQCCSVTWDFPCVVLATHFCQFECSGPNCGDGECDATENCAVCLTDCGSCSLCGDGICATHESCASCAADCGPCAACGDGICDVLIANEDCTSCPDDCGPCWRCPNHICEFATGETHTLCPQDCYCGDSICLFEQGENTWTCPLDCYCGDGLCESLAGENHTSCPLDCSTDASFF